MRMRSVEGVLVYLALFLSSALGENYFWNYRKHPYQTYYLEDYCGPTEKINCHGHGNTIYLNSTGSGSALIVRGFRSEKPDLSRNVKCCITVKTLNWNNLNVQLDEIYMKQQQLGRRCENFLRFHDLGEELGHICNKIKEFSFRTPKNIMEIDYVLNSENVLDFQKIKVVVTATSNATKLSGGVCDATQEQWQCSNNGCIWEGFRCDAQNNCGDWSDEVYCGFFWHHMEAFIGLMVALMLLITGCCLYRCCCQRRKKQQAQLKGFQFVTSLGPNSQPIHQVPQQALYPQLHSPYQGAVPPRQMSGPPPAYTENAHLTPAYNPTYGSTSKN